MYIVFRPSIVDYIVKSRAGGMWGGDLNVPVDLYLIQNYYIDRTEDFLINCNMTVHASWK